MNSIPELPEIVPKIGVMCSTVLNRDGILNWFIRYSNWLKIVKVAASFLSAVNKFKGISLSILNYKEAEHFILKELQKESFPEIYKRLVEGKALPSSERVVGLSPWIDKNGLMRAGGRLQKSEFTFEEKHPIIIPAKHPITLTILSYFHEKVHHQGRLVTYAELRKAGFHIMNSRAVLRSFLNSCVICKRLRGKLVTQQMAQLPEDRIERCAPFERCGLDVFDS